MSEFKYACPVCAQHIRCDSSQAGSIMTCPTCFQEIIIPQAPADGDQKLILTGTKAGDRASARPPAPDPGPAPPSRPVPGMLVVLAIFLFIGLAVGFVYHGTILQPLFAGKPARPVPATNAPAPMPAPPSDDDTNWLLNLAGVRLPDSPAGGRIHGQAFHLDRAVFAHGTLILRTGRHGPVTLGVSISFKGAQAAALAGKNINILADTNKSARVTLHWQEDSTAHHESYEINYALRLEFEALAGRHLPGRIYLCLPDPEKSYVLGRFEAETPGSGGPPP